MVFFRTYMHKKLTIAGNFVTGTREDVFHQLEREVSSSNHVIAQQQEEITELQQMCCVLKRVRITLAYCTFVVSSRDHVQFGNEKYVLKKKQFIQRELATKVRNWWFSPG